VEAVKQIVLVAVAMVKLKKKNAITAKENAFFFVLYAEDINIWMRGKNHQSSNAENADMRNAVCFPLT